MTTPNKARLSKVWTLYIASSTRQERSSNEHLYSRYSLTKSNSSQAAKPSVYVFWMKMAIYLTKRIQVFPDSFTNLKALSLSKATSVCVST